jgi:hypothetical protein
MGTEEPQVRRLSFSTEGNMRTKHRSPWLVVAIVVALLCGTAFADVHTGTIERFHLNSDVQGRGVCIRMIPDIPTGWACVWEKNPLYKDIMAMLLEAFANERICTLVWNQPGPDTHPDIFLAECYMK